MKIIFFDVRENEIEPITNFCQGKHEFKLISDSLDDKTELTEEIKNADV